MNDSQIFSTILFCLAGVLFVGQQDSKKDANLALAGIGFGLAFAFSFFWLGTL
jgi:hypothetical protein